MSRSAQPTVLLKDELRQLEDGDLEFSDGVVHLGVYGAATLMEALAG